MESLVRRWGRRAGAEVAVRVDDEFVYVDDAERGVPLCLLRETAHPGFWSFALARGGRYVDGCLPSGAWTGAAEELLDHAWTYRVTEPPMPDPLSYAGVVHALVEAVPELREDLELHVFNEHGILPHVFVDLDVTPFVLDAWARGDRELVGRCLAFLERAMTAEDPDTRALVGTSFVPPVRPWDPAVAGFLAIWPPALARQARREIGE